MFSPTEVIAGESCALLQQPAKVLVLMTKLLRCFLDDEFACSVAGLIFMVSTFVERPVSTLSLFRFSPVLSRQSRIYPVRSFCSGMVSLPY